MSDKINLCISSNKYSRGKKPFICKAKRILSYRVQDNAKVAAQKDLQITYMRKIAYAMRLLTVEVGV